MTPSKAMASIRSLSLSVTAALVMMSPALSADAPNPFIGKWALDLQKTTFNPGPPGLKSQMLVVTQVPGASSSTRSVVDTVGSDGSTYHVEYTSANDGKPTPTSGDSDSDSVVLTAMGPNTVKAVFTKAGKTTSVGTFIVSKSGKSMRGMMHGTNADGSKWKIHSVYVRQ